MKIHSNQLLVACFLALVSHGIQAQFDDVYYDPDRDGISKEYDVRPQDQADPAQDATEFDYFDESDYDDASGEWESQDYYYTSRIRRFHRPVYGIDFYDPYYTHYSYYDPWDFDPWYQYGDIYSGGWNVRFNTGPVRWAYGSYYGRPYWSYHDWYYGWNPFPFAYVWGYRPYSFYSCNFYHWNYYRHGHHRNGYFHHGFDGNDHDRRYHYGSRNFGLTNTSRHGPVRLRDQSPVRLVEAEGTPVITDRSANPPRRVVRQADGDTYVPKSTPAPKSKVDRSTPEGTEAGDGYVPQRSWRRPAPERSSRSEEFPSDREERVRTDRPEPERSLRPHRSYKPQDAAQERSSRNGAPERSQKPSREERKFSPGQIFKDLNSGNSQKSGDRESSRESKKGSSRKSPR